MHFPLFSYLHKYENYEWWNFEDDDLFNHGTTLPNSSSVCHQNRYMLLGCCIRFSCILIKWYLQLARITIPPIKPLYPIFSPPSGWTNWTISEVNFSKLNWRHFNLQYIHTYLTSIVGNLILQELICVAYIMNIRFYLSSLTKARKIRLL